MGHSRTLCRKLDLDLIARIEAGGKPLKHKQPKRRKPRAAVTYRGARRNAALQVRRDAKKAARQMRRAA